MKGMIGLSVHKEQEIEDVHSHSNKVQLFAKIMEKKGDDQWLLEAVDKKSRYLIRIDDDAIFDEGISTDLIDGNVVIINAVENEEGDQTHRAVEVIANDQDHVIKVDKRETISAYLGIFPDGLLDMEQQNITIAKDKTVAVSLKQEKGQRWIYNRVEDELRLLSYHEEDEEGYGRQHWGFVVGHEGECAVHFTCLNERDEVIRDITFHITTHE